MSFLPVDFLRWLDPEPHLTHVGVSALSRPHQRRPSPVSIASCCRTAALQGHVEKGVRPSLIMWPPLPVDGRTIVPGLLRTLVTHGGVPDWRNDESVAFESELSRSIISLEPGRPLKMPHPNSNTPCPFPPLQAREDGDSGLLLGLHWGTRMCERTLLANASECVVSDP